MSADDIKGRLISIYKSKGAPKGKNISIADFFESIKSNQEWKAYVEFVREVRDNPDLYDERKGRAAVAIIGGTFGESKALEHLQEPSGLMAIDLDHLNERTDSVISLLSNDPHVLAVFRSIGGRGVCIVFLVDFERWLDAFNGIQEYLTKTYGLVGKQFDQSSKNKNRLRYISYDLDIRINWNAKPFTKYPKREKKKVVPVINFIDTERDIEFVIEQIRENQVDIAPGYDEWYKVAWALISEYGEAARQMFAEISQFNDQFDPEECDKKFDYLVSTRPHTITISYFFARAKDAGLDLTSPISKTAATSASQSKKNGVSLESAVQKIVEMTNITEAEARPVVEQVYKSKQSFQSDDSIFDQLELFLRQNFLLKYNEVRRVFEDQNDNQIEDHHLKAMYVDARKVVSDELRYQDFDILVHSHKVFPKFHPIKAFFNANKHLKPVGVIHRLIETITSDTALKTGETTNAPGFVHKYMRKFFIGMIENVYDETPCPLVPIFTGEPNTGKTYWFRHMLPDELISYLVQTKWKDNKDELLRMCTNWVAFNDDFDVKNATSQEYFRGLTSQDWVTVREPYGRKDVRLKRLAIMCATSNPKNVIQDPEFNRRIIPINVIKFNWDAYNAINKVELLLEAYHAYINGERSTLSRDDVLELQEFTLEFHSLTLEQQLVDQYLQRPTEGSNLVNIEHLSTTEILSRLELQVNNRKLNVNALGAALQARKFERSQKRRGPIRVTGYAVIYLSEVMTPVTFAGRDN